MTPVSVPVSSQNTWVGPGLECSATGTNVSGSNASACSATWAGAIGDCQVSGRCPISSTRSANPASMRVRKAAPSGSTGNSPSSFSSASVGTVCSRASIRPVADSSAPRISPATVRCRTAWPGIRLITRYSTSPSGASRRPYPNSCGTRSPSGTARCSSKRASLARDVRGRNRCGRWVMTTTSPSSRSARASPPDSSTSRTRAARSVCAAAIFSTVASDSTGSFASGCR